MNHAVLDFISSIVDPADVTDKSVLEVGALDVNGSARSVLSTMAPAAYLGVDMQEGRGVDRVLTVSFLTDLLGAEAFDLVVSTEMLEHVQDWRWAVSQLKRAVKPGGRLLVTTRSPGFYYHGYPHDFWRFTEADFRRIFSDMTDVVIASDPSEPGVFVYARRPLDFTELDLTSIVPATCPDPPLGSLKKHIMVTLRSRLRRLKRRLN